MRALASHISSVKSVPTIRLLQLTSEYELVCTARGGPLAFLRTKLVNTRHFATGQEATRLDSWLLLPPGHPVTIGAFKSMAELFTLT